jgi:UDP-4-amino-4,6-dideoxy-N-acetyl-beta-L-altrosamine transaminase
MIPYGHQQIDEDDIAAVVAVLRSDFLTQGPAIERFEQAMAERCGVPYAVAVSNATAALHLAYQALGMAPGRSGWTSPNTFVASANGFRYCGGDVDFVDIDPHTWNLSPATLAAKLAEAEREGRLPHIVTPVHFGGQSCDMAAIGELAQRYGFAVVEDASHAVGASYRGEPVGCCRHSDISVFSFHPVKIITTGEGGMLLTRRRDLYEHLLRLRSHGITRDPAQLQQPAPGPWYYEQQELGFNYRMTDLQAALGSSQLTRLDAFVARRAKLVARYNCLFADLPCVSQAQPAGQSSAHHLYMLQVPAKKRGAAFAALRATGIGANVHYIPVHLQPYYRQRGFAPGDFPVAEAYYAGAITLPLYPDLAAAAQDLVVATVRTALA